MTWTTIGEVAVGVLIGTYLGDLLTAASVVVLQRWRRRKEMAKFAQFQQEYFGSSEGKQAVQDLISRLTATEKPDDAAANAPADTEDA